jgi:hypothetical protein
VDPRQSQTAGVVMIPSGVLWNASVRDSPSGSVRRKITDATPASPPVAATYAVQVPLGLADAAEFISSTSSVSRAGSIPRLEASFGRSRDSRHPRQTEADSITVGMSAGGGRGFRAGLRTVRATGFLALRFREDFEVGVFALAASACGEATHSARRPSSARRPDTQFELDPLGLVLCKTSTIPNSQSAR